MNAAAQGITNSDVRTHNRGLILSALAERGPLARVDLAAATGLVHGAISGLVGGLITDGLVHPAPAQSRTGQRGRPSELLALDGRHVAIVAVQVLDHEYHTLVTDLAGQQVHEEWFRVTPPQAPDASALTGEIAERIDRAAAAAGDLGMRIGAVRVVLPGGVGDHGRRFTGSLDLGWYGEVAGEPLFLERVFAQASGIETAPLGVNDANAAAFAEYTLLRRRLGAEELTDLVYLKGDVGFGGGAIVRGELVEGRRGAGFEPGHARVSGVEEVCACGQTGCLVLVASSQVVFATAGLTGLAEEQGQQAAFRELERRHARRDPAAVEAIERALEGVRQMIATTVLLFGPQLVVIGGYLAHYLDGIRALHPLVLGALGFGDLEGREAVLAGSLGELAALHGAIDAARRELLRSPVGLGR